MLASSGNVEWSTKLEHSPPTPRLYRCKKIATIKYTDVNLQRAFHALARHILELLISEILAYQWSDKIFSVAAYPGTAMHHSELLSDMCLEPGNMIYFLYFIHGPWVPVTHSNPSKYISRAKKGHLEMHAVGFKEISELAVPLPREVYSMLATRPTRVQDPHE